MNRFTISDRTVIYFSCLLVAVLCGSACNKFLAVDPPADKVVSSEIFQDDKSALAAVAGLYSNIMQTEGLFSFYMTADGGLLADELNSHTPGNQYIDNSLTAVSPDMNNFWSKSYALIFSVNSIINGVSQSTVLSADNKSQLLGEASFVRGFIYFYLVNLWGGVPVITSTDYRATASLPRSSIEEVYSQIMTDLTKAEQLLPVTYASTERNRPSKWAVTALLARVYLYRQQWMKADSLSGLVINSNQYSLLPAVKDICLKNNAEAIWQLSPVNLTYNTFDAKSFITTPTAWPVYPVQSGLVSAFESGDRRKDAWLGTSLFSGATYYYPFKYKTATGPVINDYYNVLRLAEQFLVRAEARAMSNNLAGAISDINIIRTRAGLPVLKNSLNSNEILQAIQQERRVELCFEWGHRWLDLKRTNQVDSVLSKLKPSWSTYKSLWPISQTQIILNTSLSQNPGY